MEDKLIGAGLVVLGGKDIIVKLLGPTASYLGQETKNMVQKCNVNIGRIFNRATKLLGNKIEQPGVVNPRILRHIINEGAFCEDELSAEYFGGVLASSRSEVSRDDRGTSIIALLSRLSTYQIRTHYIFYHILKNLFDNSGINIADSEGRNRLEIYIPFSVYLKAMDFGKNENMALLIEHAMFGLWKERLIEEFFRYGSKEYLKQVFAKVTEDGIIFQPTCLGAELFLWAYGKANLQTTDLLNPVNKFDVDSNIVIPLGYDKTKNYIYITGC